MAVRLAPDEDELERVDKAFFPPELLSAAQPAIPAASRTDNTTDATRNKGSPPAFSERNFFIPQGQNLSLTCRTLKLALNRFYFVIISEKSGRGKGKAALSGRTHKFKPAGVRRKARPDSKTRHGRESAPAMARYAIKSVQICSGAALLGTARLKFAIYSMI